MSKKMDMDQIWKWAQVGLGSLAALYLLNLGFGIVEVIPDNTPLAGNIDEVVATVLLLRGLAEMGVHLISKKE